jgi:hypothetical protein
MSEPWNRTTLEDLQAKAEALDLPTTGTREVLYHRIEQALRDKVLEMDVTDEEAELVRGVAASRALAAVPDQVESAMDEWKSGVVEPVSTLPDRSHWEQMEIMAKVLARSAIIPKGLRTGPDVEANVMVMLIAAHDLGLTSTLAFQKIHVIDGQPSLAAELMRILMQRDGHDFKINVATDAQGHAVEAEVLINRKEWRDEDWRGESYSMEDARTAGLTSKTNWKQHPRAMLIARATAHAARLYCPDSLGGISYTPDELGAIDVDGVDWNAPSPTPEPVPLAENRRAQVSFLIAGLEEPQRVWLAEQWKTKGIPSLNPKRADAPPLTEEWMPSIIALIDDAAAQPTDAVVVEEEEDAPTGAAVPAYTSGATATQSTGDPTAVNMGDPIRDETARAYARSHRAPKEDVPTLDEHLAATDAALAGSKEERAEIARRVLAEAKEGAVAANIIDAVCPDCGVAMSKDNRACNTHPL